MTIVFTIILFLFVAISVISLYWLKIDMYFLQFKLEKHPMLIAMLEDVFQRICIEEGIRVFQKTYEELNINRPIEDDKALGMYVYTLDAEHQRRANKCLREIEELEIKWKMPYKKLCQFVDSDTALEREDFVLPRILLCKKEEFEKYGLLSYYSTHFHELGHHFAVKEIGKHTEDDANRIAHRLIIQNFPYFFQLIPFINFRYRTNMKELASKEKLRACIEYLQYLRVKNKKREVIL
jgi:hypothetical protein